MNLPKDRLLTMISSARKDFDLLFFFLLWMANSCHVLSAVTNADESQALLKSMQYPWWPETDYKNEFIIAAILPNGSDIYFDYNNVSRIMQVGVHDLNEQIQNEFRQGKLGLFGNFSVSVEFVDTEGVASCNQLESRVAFLASKWMKNRELKLLKSKEQKHKRVLAWIGPGCSLGAQQLGHLVREWNLTWIDGASTSTKLDNKVIYPTLTRTGWTMRRMAQFIEKVFEMYGWYNFALIYDNEDPIWSVFAQSLADYFKNRTSIEPLGDSHRIQKGGNVTVPTYSFVQYLLPHNSANVHDTSESFYATFESIKSEARIVLFVGGVELARSFLLVAQDDGYTTDEWTFVVPDLFVVDQRRNLEGESRHHNSLKKIFKRVLLITLEENTLIFKNISEKLCNGNCGGPEKPPLLGVVNYYSSIRIFGDVLLDSVRNKSLNETDLSGSSFADLMKKRTFVFNLTPESFESATRFDPNCITIILDENGDVRGDFALQAFHNGNFTVAYRYTAFDTELQFVQNTDYIPSLNEPACGFLGENCLSTSIIVAIVFLCTSFIGAVGWFAFTHRKLVNRLKEVKVQEKWWEISYSDLNLQGRTQNTFPRRLESCSNPAKSTLVEPKDAFLRTVQHGTFKGSPVVVMFIRKEIPLDMAMYCELKKIRDLNHENLVRIIGICMEVPHQAVVTEHCSRGKLPVLILNDPIKLEWAFRFSLIADLLEGMSFIHKTAYEYHGTMTSFRCMIDSRFCLKIRGYSMKFLRTEVTDPEMLLWTAPELLRTKDFSTYTASDWRAADIYSVAVIMKEIATRTRAYAFQNLDYEDEPTCGEVIEKIRNPFKQPAYRPQIYGLPSVSLSDLIQSCWAEEPRDRPTISQVIANFTKARRCSSSSNIFEDLMVRLERYANQLEDLVKERTQQFLEQKQKTEELLHELLPKTVATRIIEEGKVPPEAYDCVTVYFSDIVAFTTLSAESSPLEIVEFLNGLFSLFDQIIDDYDAYKVETVGDAYMVVSGLPHRNGEKHASEIAKLALRILQASNGFQIPHRRNETIQMRIGLHSGPCMAGVVGRRMPRYCLFGDTVNTASRMESTGEPGKIQMTADTARRLIPTGNFQIKSRGNIPVKGKGIMETYWLMSVKHKQLSSCWLESDGVAYADLC